MNGAAKRRMALSRRKPTKIDICCASQISERFNRDFDGALNPFVELFWRDPGMQSCVSFFSNFINAIPNSSAEVGTKDCNFSNT